MARAKGSGGKGKSRSATTGRYVTSEHGRSSPKLRERPRVPFSRQPIFSCRPRACQRTPQVPSQGFRPLPLTSPPPAAASLPA
ncbi:Hypothetical Protein RradSPS_3159 (plasmid) [Rubrobacter radiotolerans]|uniref:Uncharacterized protein n=1 Tax=Rubrobacter radiotolerans TaxID=42256 RepID=A0A023X7N8_RUBRA|nr:Hypothetical Protein RradSPS_3159 [Rubrobacter radiotolerans]